MPDVKARYWGIGRQRIIDGSTRIGEVQFYPAEAGGEEMANITGTSLYSEWLSTIELEPGLLESMDNDLSTQQVITQNIGRAFGIALDCGAGAAIRMIMLRNINNKPAESFVPFAIDSLDYFVGGALGTGKIQGYSIAKTIEEDGTINCMYTILPIVESDQPSIIQSFTKEGVCK